MRKCKKISLPMPLASSIISWSAICVNSFVLKPPLPRQCGDLSLYTTSCGGDHDSLSHLLSSPERYAAIMGKTTREIQLIQDERKLAARALQEALDHNPDLSSTERQFLVSQYRYQYGKHNFVCPVCWSYQPICLCQNITAMMANHSNSTKLAIPFREIIVWTHPEEWGSPTNTGSLLPLLLQHTQLWMKGYHDKQMNEIFQDENRPMVVLWPAPNSHDDGASRASSPKQKQRSLLFDHQDKRGDHRHLLPDPESLQEISLSSANVNQITLIAIEGTWRQARRMVSKLKKSRGDGRHNLFQLSIPIKEHEEGSRSDKSFSFRSLLHPLRRKSRSMCTAEAVVAACQQFEHLARHPKHAATTITVPVLYPAGRSNEQPTSIGKISQYDVILEWVNRKVDLTRRYQGKPLS